MLPLIALAWVLLVGYLAYQHGYRVLSRHALVDVGFTIIINVKFTPSALVVACVVVWISWGYAHDLRMM